MDANSTISGNQAFAWTGTGAGRLSMQGGILTGDVNGDGRADLQIDLGSAWVTQGDVLL